MKQLIEKYSGSLPRYTSYPTALELRPLNSLKFIEAQIQRCADLKFSLYVHLPFCPSLCYFCACNKIITKDIALIEQYIKFFDLEARLYKEIAGKKITLSQIHFGGGSPSYFTPVQINSICESIWNNFNVKPEASKSVELDPRTAAADKIAAYKDWGFKRASLGVQDFDPQVQQAINRTQSFEQVKTSRELLLEHNFSNINFDLVYGLPLQTESSFINTAKQVLSLKPDKISFYGYAHVNWKTKVQNVFNKLPLPTPEERAQIFLKTEQLFKNAGYIPIGMDHFCLPEDEFIVASNNRTLRRNFMGYTIVPAEGIIGLGVSAISDINGSIYQNTTEINLYEESLNKNELPVVRYLVRTDEDKTRGLIIEQLMCFSQASIDTREKRKILESSYQYLWPFIQDQLVIVTENMIEVPESGRLFLRNIASAFDQYLHNKEAGKRFSQAV